jgi:hypothetical protein
MPVYIMDVKRTPESNRAEYPEGGHRFILEAGFLTNQGTTSKNWELN